MKAALFMGSDSDWPIMKPAVELLKEFGVEVDVIVASAHRTPAKVHEYAENARENGVGVIIAAAGAAAHLAGVIASYTTLPVIGVPINATPLNGLDALLSTVQMPSGIPVATMAVNGAKNAAVFALEIFGAGDAAVAKQLEGYREKLREGVAKKAARVASQVNQ
ncbi:5-(carboxyamino)imidazole ribonucleotide mutase [Selenomonas sputigena]|uniref:N5-carboxyaminoimidazole ribonucleotide mutase n=1 Tax=Selenomonas sputigena (strain ATCC 35185 / DSM 20758 / CCUG 44933 / VPI D19B-28) TaxID=546271 RepID=C9LRY0_SELS3|nr:5-(carboxyamino)imidazole ribonucleotide mutase [Selenomonas sputigena]AEB99974.1 phosphoribosylaminoimidazole carboxylase, catalytic subunit [Selenomonas sputigena ATCC 35185]EEX78398.1 phosphoribosylaminoimidazole carboxylase, catalytic subunit [Selenomonas sputigena ATCC 35185]UZD43872.1 5-(carboxyamino)imidazole ribonucleotide mutase [Selenomonas sputigena]UZE45888.1 5-(carboxyamino)imidazole ribonucleotide mutase [Selenomonas sputigena]